MDALAPGATVDRFELVQELGRGGMGSVWAARDAASGTEVAIKVLVDNRGDPAAVRRMIREALAGQELEHPHVVPVRELVELADGSPALVMDLLRGETLAARLRRERVLSVADTVRILLPAVSGIAAAHARGIVHRDLKPENVFLVDSGEGGAVVRVLDFGIAKVVSPDELEAEASTETGTLLGTPFYMSPEQVFGEKDVDHRSDIWSLGLLAYECLSGVLPTRADRVGQVLKIILTRPFWPLRDVVPEVPADLAELVDRMLTRDREGRPFDLREVAAVLIGHYEGPAVPEALAPSSRWVREAFTPAATAAAPTDSTHERSIPQLTTVAAKRASRPPARSGRVWSITGAAAIAGVAASLALALGPRPVSACRLGISRALTSSLDLARQAPASTSEERAAVVAVAPVASPSARAAATAPPPNAARPAVATATPIKVEPSAGAAPTEPSRETVLNRRK